MYIEYQPIYVFLQFSIDAAMQFPDISLRCFIEHSRNGLKVYRYVCYMGCYEAIRCFACTIETTCTDTFLIGKFGCVVPVRNLLINLTGTNLTKVFNVFILLGL